MLEAPHRAIAANQFAMLLGSTLFGSALAASPEPPPDKRGFHLFNPTPTALLREMTADRPDKTESPYTVDAGRFQIEMDVVNYTHDHDTSGGADVYTDSFAIAPVNLKVGLLHNLDFQLVLETYNRARGEDKAAGTVSRMSGFGDVTPRFKINLWGNDGGPTALGLMPFVKLPSNQNGLGNNSVEGGLIVPLAVELPAGWGMGFMTEVDFLRKDGQPGHYASFINSITFSHDIVGNLGGYVEFFSEVSSQSNSEWVGTVDLGLTYGLTQNIQLDGGINFGVTRSAPDFNPFLGISWRF